MVVREQELGQGQLKLQVIIRFLTLEPNLETKYRKKLHQVPNFHYPFPHRVYLPRLI
jgi:hypothetical protein